MTKNRDWKEVTHANVTRVQFQGISLIVIVIDHQSNVPQQIAAKISMKQYSAANFENSWLYFCDVWNRFLHGSTSHRGARIGWMCVGCFTFWPTVASKVQPLRYFLRHPSTMIHSSSTNFTKHPNQTHSFGDGKYWFASCIDVKPVEAKLAFK